MLSGSLADRFPEARSRRELPEAELQRWEAEVHRIASAFCPPEPAAAGPPPPTLPRRVEADGAGGGGGLYLGDAASARDVEGLLSRGIEAVLNCGAPAVDYPPGSLRHLELSCEDAEDYPLLAKHLDRGLAFLEQCEAEARGGGGLLVHCVMGLNRSASLLVAFLMLRRGLPLLQAVGQVWECRGRSPLLTNRSFRRQLVQLAHLTGHLG